MYLIFNSQLKNLCYLFFVVAVGLGAGCSISDARYQPDGYNEAKLATLSGSGPTIEKIDPNPNTEIGQEFWVNIAYVQDSDGKVLVEPNAWSGNYKRVHLPGGVYLVRGRCWIHNAYAFYEIVINLKESRQYQLHCEVENYNRSFWSGNVSGEPHIFVKEKTSVEGQD